MILSNRQKRNILSRFISILMVFMILFSTGRTVYGSSLQIGCESAILIETETGKVLYEKNADIKRPIASTTKIMTYILVMEAVEEGKISLNDKVKVSKVGANAGGSSYKLRENEVITVDELLNSMMIISANDSAVVLSEHVSGSVENFCIKMNEKAKSLGLESAYFVNPNGMPLKNKDQNRMSARDMALLSKYALDNYGDILLKTTGQKQFQGVYKPFSGKNTNKLLENTSFIDGLKTGYTDLAGYCLVSTAKVSGSQSGRFISVVLGGKSGDIRFNDSKKMIEYGINNFEEKIVIDQGEFLGYSQILSDEYIPIELVAKDSVSVIVNKNSNVSINKEILLKYFKDNNFDDEVLNGEEVQTVLKLHDGSETKVNLIANRGISVFIDDNPIIFKEMNPLLKDEITFVPLRQIFESIGLQVHWDPLTKTITGQNDNIQFTMPMDGAVAILNGEDIELEVPPIIVGGITMVPVRFIAETLGAEIQWHDDIRTINIYKTVY